MAYAYGNSLNDRKQALIKKLSGGGRMAGGGAGGVPFGALPKLGFNPQARSAFGKNERFNFSGSAPGFQGDVSQYSGPDFKSPPEDNPNQGLTALNGLGPAAGSGSGGIGRPPGDIAQQYSGGGGALSGWQNVPGAAEQQSIAQQYSGGGGGLSGWQPSAPGGVNVEFLRSLGISPEVIASMVAQRGGGGLGMMTM